MHRKNAILDRVIHDCRQKQAPIIKWEFSPNNRIVLYMHGKLPHYFLNHFSAIDFLIHSYNLKTDYKHLYQTPKKHLYSTAKNDAPSTGMQPEWNQLKNKLILNTQMLIREESRRFTQKDELHIFNAINHTFGWHNVDRTVFDKAREILETHYSRRLDDAENKYHAVFLRKVVTFLQNLTFGSFSEHY